MKGKGLLWRHVLNAVEMVMWKLPVRIVMAMANSIAGGALVKEETCARPAQEKDICYATDVMVGEGIVMVIYVSPVMAMVANHVSSAMEKDTKNVNPVGALVV